MKSSVAFHTRRWFVAVVVSFWTATAWAQPSYINFESGPTRPIAISADGTRLFAVNTPDNQLEIFDVSGTGLVHLSSIAVGMEPVAVAARANGDVWVVNHLSDSVSIVDPAAGRVVQTLLVGDEPRDIVFAGTSERAFITTAHRGQQRTHSSISAVPGAGDPELITPGVSRADVWVFDADSPGGDVGGIPLRIIELFGDTPRALAASPDGGTVYAAILNSGNQTTALNSRFICPGFDPFSSCLIAGLVPAPGGQLGPATNHQGLQAPEVGLILEFNQSTGQWLDVLGRNWTLYVRFNLPDKDVFAIDADTLLETSFFAGVGTTLYNIAVHPTSGKVYVSNTDSQNTTRFEGPGVFGASTVQGHLAESRITVLDGASVLPRHLNKHIDYSTLANQPGFDPDARHHSLATPLEMAFSDDGSTLYVAAFGSGRVGVFSTAEIDADTFDPTTASANYISVTGGGPAGLVLDGANDRLFVYTRFDNGVSIVDLNSGQESDHRTFHTPESVEIVEGRPLLYDAFETSGNGEASCSSCHIFGDTDHISWDLGNPDDDVVTSPLNILNPGVAIFAPSPINGTGEVTDFHPMKGPMATQTLRGMVNHGSLHWRGDRSNGFFGIDALDSDLSFRNFIVAFEGLVGREEPISESDMQKFSDFALSLTLPPNPNRALDNSLTTEQQAGRDFYINTTVDGSRTCVDCHDLDASQGFFGAGGNATFEGNSQIFKVAHLRNLYTKVGMFGLLAQFGGGIAHQGDQVRGYGFSHDGSVDTLFRFISGVVFNFPNDTTKREMEEFIFAFDTDLAPVVGQQVTLDSSNAASVGPRIDLLIARAQAAFTSEILGGATTECDLVAKGSVGGLPRGWRMLPGGSFQADNDPSATSTLTDVQLRALATSEGPITYTCVTPGAGLRAGIDRDEDSILDGLDNCPGVANPGQEDLDTDNIGDACDALSCGDAFVGDLEDCDDGDLDDGDGCDSGCAIEVGFVCGGEPSLCSPVASQSTTQQKCLNEINKRASLVTREQGKVTFTCMRDFANGKTHKLGNPPQQQTANACPTNDVRDKVQKRIDTLALKEAQLCFGTGTPDYALLGSAAVAATVPAESIGLTTDLFGANLDAAWVTKVVDRRGADCQREVQKRAHAVVEESWKVGLAAKKDGLKGSVDSVLALQDAIFEDLESDPKRRIERATDRLATLTAKRCDHPDVVTPLASLFPGVCGGIADSGALAECAGEVARCTACRSINAADGLAMDCDVFDNDSRDGSCP